MSKDYLKNTYWNRNGKYEKAYQHFYEKLVPSSGNASSPEGELFRIMGKIYYRHFNDGDVYWNMIEDGYEKLTSIKDINLRFLKSLENDLLESNYERGLEQMADRCIRYVILKNSTPNKILNPQTLRLVNIKTPQGQKILEELDCKVQYTYEL